MEKMKSNVVETIPPDKHVLICGGTGSGKSFLAEQYLKGYEYVVKLDTKNETAERRKKGLSPWQGLEEHKDFTVTSNFEELDEITTKKIIYNPDYYSQDEETFNRFFDWIFLRENTIVWIDELMSVANAHKTPRALLRCYTQGRSKQIGIWACSQRPAGIPSICLANSDYYFIFNLNNVNDRRRIYDMTGFNEMMILPKGHNFWYYKIGEEHPPIKAKLVM